jgi:hypothetical protein
MKTSKTFMLVTIFSFAVASAWVAAPKPADAQKASTTAAPAATMKKPCTSPGCAGPPKLPNPTNPTNPKPK